jgi:hypothetical protein
MKITSNVLIACLMTGSVLSFAGAVGAETVMKIKTTGVAVFNVKNINLADGSIVQITDSRYVWTASEGDTAGQTWGGFCYGLGRVTPEGVYTGEARCEDNGTAEDSYNVEYTENVEGGDWVVTGGKGKFKGATGGGHITYIWGDTVFGDKLTMTSEGTITLP